MRTKQIIKADELLWSNLEAIHTSVGVSEDYLAESLGFHKTKYLFHKYNKLSIPYINVKKLSDNIGITLDSILQNNLNKNHLKDAIKIISLTKMPVKYQVGDGSKSFSIRHLLKAAKRYGIYEELCTHFELDKIIFENTIDFPVCVQLASDILGFIDAKIKLSEEDFDNMSYANAMYFQESHFGKMLSSTDDFGELYDTFLAGVNFVEDNWKYKLIMADNKKVVIQSFPSERLSDIYKRRDYTSSVTSKFRVSMASHITQYKGFKGAKASIAKSIHNGNDFCQFEINFTDLVPVYLN